MDNSATQLTLYWFMAASSSASTWALSCSSMPLVLSNLLEAAAVPNAELVEERAETADFTLR